MNPRTVEALNHINQRFYDQESAERFHATRETPWPGFERVVDELPAGGLRVLDVGCGNGRLLRFLDRTRLSSYTGVDQSQALLRHARRVDAAGLPVHFEHYNLLEDALPRGEFELVALFGVMHHVPGEAQRRALLQQAATRLTRSGVLAVTFWRFAELSRFDGHRRDWGEAGLDPSEREPGDHLLTFQGRGLRYCHHCDAAEQERLCDGLGLQGLARFRADGRSDDLNDYVLLRR